MVDHSTRVDAVVAAPPFSRISWGSILAGTVCAFAIQLLLNLLGLGLGMASVDFSDPEGSFASVGIGAGIWWGVSSLIALLTGGWIAGRLCGVPIRVTAALHGASVWALATLLAVLLATSSLASVVSGAFGAVGQVGQAAASAASGIAASAGDVNLPRLAGEQNALGTANEQRASVMRSIRGEAREIYRRVVSQREQERALDAAEDTAGAIARSPGDIGQDLNRMVDRLFAQNGVFGEEDRQEAMAILEDRFGIAPDEAEAILANWEERYQAAAGQVEAAVSELRSEAADAAETAAEAVGAVAGWTSLALFLGLLAAIVGGVLGKPQPWMVEAVETA